MNVRFMCTLVLFETCLCRCTVARLQGVIQRCCATLQITKNELKGSQERGQMWIVDESNKIHGQCKRCCLPWVMASARGNGHAQEEKKMATYSLSTTALPILKPSKQPKRMSSPVPCGTDNATSLESFQANRPSVIVYCAHKAFTRIHTKCFEFQGGALKETSCAKLAGSTSLRSCGHAFEDIPYL
jgi:hypothetical protein